MSRRIVYHHLFWEDVVGARQWLEERAPGVVSDFIGEIESCLDVVPSLPESFPEIRGGIRRVVIDRFKYLVFYRVRPDVIEFLGVVYGARDVDAWLKKRSKRA